MDLASLIKATRRLSVKSNIDKLVISAASENSAEIIKLNHSQLEVGELNDGDKTQEYSSINYTNYKSSIGSKSLPNADLKVTGKFYDGWEVDTKALSLNISSTDSKAPDLVKKYTSDIYGLQNKNLTKISVLTAPIFAIKIKNELTK